MQLSVPVLEQLSMTPTVALLCLLDWQVQSLGGLSHQGDGGSGARPVCPADAGAAHRPLSAAGAAGPAGTPRPTQPNPRDPAAGV